MRIPAIKYIKLLLPAVLIAVLVIDAICAYEAPDLSKYVSPAGDVAAAAVKKPAIKMKEQKKKAERKAPGAGGALGKIKESGEYRDGRYTGIARGFGGPVTVEVEIKKSRITGVKIVSAPGEDAAYLGKARKLTGIIVKKNSTNVDAVSGATYSSNGIIMAARNALAKAAIKGKDGKKHSDKKTSKKNNVPEASRKIKKDKVVKPDAITEGVWKDGSYSGRGEGFGGLIEVTVVISGGRIHSITIGKNSEDKDYLARAKNGIISEMIKKQGTDVDTVSGATYSSVGIITAVNDALKKAAQDHSEKNSSNADGKADDSGAAGGGPDDPEKDKDKVHDQTEHLSYTEITKIVRVYCDEDEDFDDYDLEITFRISGNKVTGILSAKQTVAAPDNESYIRAALNGIKRQLSAKPDFQGIDTVSGATCTSKGIIEGGQLALSETKNK